MIQVRGIVFKQACRNFERIVNGILLVNILIKSVVKIEVIKFREIDLGDIGMDKTGVVKAEIIAALFGIMQELMTLLDAVVITIRMFMRRCEAKLADTAANIQYPGAWNCQILSRLTGNRQRRPVLLRDQLQVLGVKPVKRGIVLKETVISFFTHQRKQLRFLPWLFRRKGGKGIYFNHIQKWD